MANLTVKLLELSGIPDDRATEVFQQALRGDGGVAVALPVAPPPAALPPAPEKPQRGRRRAEAGDDSIRGQILEQLAKRPMGSIELMNLTCLDIGKVKDACAKLRAAGRIVQKIQDSDGTRLWMLPAKK